MTNSHKWLGRQKYFAEQGQLTNRKIDLFDIHTPVSEEAFEPGFAYTLKVNSKMLRVLSGLKAISYAMQNPYGYENFNQEVAIYLVDNNLEKNQVRQFIRELNFDLGELKIAYSAEELNFCTKGLVLVTADELPELVEKLTKLTTKREAKTYQLLNYVLDLQTKLNGQNPYLYSLDPEHFEKIYFLLSLAEIELDPNQNFTISGLLDLLEDLTSYLLVDSVEYVTVHENNGSKQEFRYRNCPVSVIYVHSGYLYNKPEYLKQRRYLLTFLKCFAPSVFIWTDLQRQDHYTPVEQFTRFPVRQVEVKMNETPFFLRGLDNFSDNEVISATALFDYQDVSYFSLPNELASVTLRNHNQLTMEVSNGFETEFTPYLEQGLSLLAYYALYIASRDLSTVLVTPHKDEIIAKLNQLVTAEQIRNFNLDQLAILTPAEVAFFPYPATIQIIDAQTQLTTELLADIAGLRTLDLVILDSGYEFFNRSKQQVIFYGFGLNGTAEENLDVLNSQEEVVRRYLRNYQDNPRTVEYPESNQRFFPSYSEKGLQSLDYFNHQESRNWNSQLSSDKFLTVRLNNREVSYYPNLSSNPYVIAGFNLPLFDNALSLMSSRASDLNIETKPIQNLLLNSGDIIVNISIAIHRIINLFSDRNSKVPSRENITAVWLVSDQHKELIQLYTKLFTNIFNKEDKVSVDISTAEDLVKKEPEFFSKENYDKLQTQKAAYYKQLSFLNNLIIFLKQQGVDLGLDSLDSVDKIYARILDLFQKDQYQNYQQLFTMSAILEQAIDSFRKTVSSWSADDKPGYSKLIICTVSDYFKLNLHEISPDLVVVESVNELYSAKKASYVADVIYRLHEKSAYTNLVYIASPENDISNLLEYIEEADPQPNHAPLVALSDVGLETQSSERYAYAFDFRATDFACKDLSEELKGADTSKLIKTFVQKFSTLPQVGLAGINLPLAAYKMPAVSNIDFRVLELEPLSSNVQEHFYSSAKAKAVEVFLSYFEFVENKVVNAALNILLCPKHSKSRGLVVVNDPAQEAIFQAFAEEGNFVVRNYQNIGSERAIYSCAVIVDDDRNSIDPGVIQQVALLTRSFKTVGSIFFFGNFERHLPSFYTLGGDNQDGVQNKTLRLNQVNFLTGRRDPLHYDASISPYFVPKINSVKVNFFEDKHMFETVESKDDFFADNSIQKTYFGLEDVEYEQFKAGSSYFEEQDYFEQAVSLNNYMLGESEDSDKDLETRLQDLEIEKLVVEGSIVRIAHSLEVYRDSLLSSSKNRDINEEDYKNLDYEDLINK